MDLTGVTWRKASRSASDGGNCVEVARGAGLGAVAVRDSKDPDGPKLIFTPAQWTAFASAARAGRFDLP